MVHHYVAENNQVWNANLRCVQLLFGLQDMFLSSFLDLKI